MDEAQQFGCRRFRGYRRAQGTLLACAIVVAGTLVATHSAIAQRPHLPICSDDPSYKLPPCSSAPDPALTTPPPQPASGDGSAPAAAFPFPGEDNPSSAPASSNPAPAKPAGDQFPFPGSDPASAGSQPVGSKPVTSQPAPASGGKPGSSDAFPFPGENVPLPVMDPNEKVYDPNEGKAGPPTPRPALPALPADPSSSSSSSSSSSAGGDAPDGEPAPKLKDLGSDGSTRAERRRMPKVEDMGAREEEDLKVGKFYRSTGNYMAAYLRAKDALKIDPKDPEAQFLLAVSAQKLAKKDEALAGYTEYLKLAPDGDDAKAAEKALATLK